MATFPTSVPISQSSTMKKRYRILRASFGQGAEQTAPDGSNAVIEEWNIVWENIGSSDYTTVVTNFLDTLTGSETISWNSKLYKITEDGYTVTAKSGSVWTVTFNMRQVFA